MSTMKKLRYQASDNRFVCVPQENMFEHKTVRWIEFTHLGIAASHSKCGLPVGRARDEKHIGPISD